MTCSASSRTCSSSCTAPASGNHHLGSRVAAGLDPRRRRQRDRAHLHREQSRVTSPRRTPRRPSIGLLSCSRRTAASSCSSAGSDLSALSSSNATLTDKLGRSGRNSCSGGSMRRIVTAGRPSPRGSDEVDTLQGHQCVERRRCAERSWWRDQPPRRACGARPGTCAR